jgi:hypothetical protein
VGTEKEPKIIALARQYQAKKGEAMMDIESRRNAVEHLRASGVEECRFVVWKDSRYPDSDYGETFGLLRSIYEHDPFVSVRYGDGDPFVGVLNAQAQEVNREHFEWVLVASLTSWHMLTKRVMVTVRRAMQDPRINAIGIVPPDVPSVGKGAITNQIAFWKVDFLKQIGWFDTRDTRPVDFDYERDYQGVGEFINLFKSRSPHPLAIIYPDVESGDARTVAADPRQLKKLAHKERRIKAVLKMIGKTEDDLAGLINPAHVYDLRS